MMIHSFISQLHFTDLCGILTGTQEYLADMRRSVPGCEGSVFLLYSNFSDLMSGRFISVCVLCFDIIQPIFFPFAIN